MASAISKESAKTLLRSVLLPEKSGLQMKSVPGIYREIVGSQLAFREWGFKSLELYLRSMPDVVSVRTNADGTLHCFGVADESTAHIKSLVNRQKTAKKKGKRGRPKPMFRPKPARPYRLGPPTYRAPPSRPAAFPRPTSRRPPPRPQINKSFGGPNQSYHSSSSSSSSYNSRSLSSTYKSAKAPDHREPLVAKSSFGNKSFTNNNYDSRQNARQEPTKSYFGNKSFTNNNNDSRPNTRQEPAKSSFGNTGFKNSYNNDSKQNARQEPTKAVTKSQGPPSSSVSSRGQSDHVQGGQSAFVSVISQDSKEPKPTSSSSSSRQQHSNQGNKDQAPRMLAPRFLKQMQKQMEDERKKDVQKENKRRMQAQNLAREHNNNCATTAPDQQELRITVSNDASQKQDEEEYFEPEPVIEEPAVREEWPRRHLTQETGDWRDAKITIERSVSQPGSNSSDSTDQRAHSPAHYVETRRSTPPQSPLTVASEDKPVCDWFKKELDCKASGIWRSSLNTDFKSKFGKSLTDDLVERMAGLKILTIEKVFNQEIVYPNLHIEASSSQRKVVVNGSGTEAQSIRRHHSDSGSASPVSVSSTNQPSLQRTSSVSSNTSSTPTTPTPVLSPTSPSPTTSRGGGSAPDYSHLAVPLPEDEVWEVYVSYIKHLQDFYVLIVDEEYSDRLFTLEEEMGHYYKYSRRRLQGPPAVDCMYAAELNKEWLRVMVDEVFDDHVNCFLVDHGDTERVEINKLQPLAPQFLHTPFQAIPCKLEGAEDDPENADAVQKFCELALGKVLCAEPDGPNREDAQVELVMYEDDDEAFATINDLCLSSVI